MVYPGAILFHGPENTIVGYLKSHVRKARAVLFKLTQGQCNQPVTFLIGTIWDQTPSCREVAGATFSAYIYFWSQGFSRLP